MRPRVIKQLEHDVDQARRELGTTLIREATQMDIKQAQEQVASHLIDSLGLLTAGTPDNFNTMTIAWGQTGTLWCRPMMTVYVKPTRYTFGFLQENDIFTVSLFPKQYREDLILLGTHSGRNGDKLALTNLTPKPLDRGIGFEQADLTLVCKKLLEQPLDLKAIPESIVNEYYASEGVHSMFVGEIIEAL